jgi:dTMP kinase
MVKGRGRGLLIAIEGIDQSGKRTQSKLLAAKLRESGRSTDVMNFPNYGTPIGRCLRAYLNARVRLNPHSVHLLYGANKWESIDTINSKLNRGTCLILNRYRASNLAYGSAHKLPVAWLDALEEGLPDADLVVVLDVSPDLSFKRKKRFRDLHERDRAYLVKVRNAYLQLAKKFGWHVVNGEEDSRTVNSAIWKLTVPLLKDK